MGFVLFIDFFELLIFLIQLSIENINEGLLLLLLDEQLHVFIFCGFLPFFSQGD